jgi:hypothetical protein
VTGPVHFIHLGGEFQWQHWRAVETAKQHVGPELDRRWLWTVEPERFDGREFWPHHITIKHLNPERWLLNHPIRLANVKDAIAYVILFDEGGMYLDLDTISLRPAWDLLEHDLCVSAEYHPAESHPHPYNTAAMIARQGSPVLKIAHDRAQSMLLDGESTWGAIGPHLMTDLVADFPEKIDVAPFPVLNGWSYHAIGDYYANPRDPGEDVRVIHLYSSDHLGEFYADRWMP